MNSVTMKLLSEPREQWESYWFFWLDLERPSPDSIELLGELFGFHPLALEDSRHFGQRPKLDDYEDHMFLVYYGARARRRDAGRGTRIPQRQLHHHPFTSVPFDCIAALVPEPSNPYDSNAVMVQIDGRHVGYLSREDAVAFCFRVKCRSRYVMFCAGSVRLA